MLMFVKLCVGCICFCIFVVFLSMICYGQWFSIFEWKLADRLGR